MRSSSAPTDAPGAELAAALAARGAAEVAAAGNAPLRLAPAGAAWLVRSGTVEVFAADAGGGSRLHLGTARAGDMIFGAAPLADGLLGLLGLLAVGLPGTRLLAASPADLDALARR